MKEIYVERQADILRIAVKKHGKLSDVFIEEEENEPSPGQIYKGIVKNIVPAIKSAFIDIGTNKNAYLYIEGKYEKKGIKKGDELIVEVIKEAIGEKGAKVTSAFSLPGRYCVINTDNRNISFSSKIVDEEFRKKILESMIKPQDVGIKLRTNSTLASISDINDEVKKLYEEYNRIKGDAAYKINPGILYSDGGVLTRVLRDYTDDKISKIVVDDEKDYNLVKEFVGTKNDTALSVEYYNGHRSLFDINGIEKELMALRGSRVDLPCGGYIIIEKTEAMYVIDVNTGSNVKGGMLEKTAYETNIEAAAAAATQIRLRNLSGIIVIDFIDMKDASNKNKVMKTLLQGLEDDKNKAVVFPFTELNLVQIARRRRGKNIHEFMEEDCEECSGRGKVLSLSYISILVRNEILRVDNNNSIKDIYIKMNKRYEKSVREELKDFIAKINTDGKEIYLNFTEETETFNIEPILFKNQLSDLEKYKVIL